MDLRRTSVRLTGFVQDTPSLSYFDDRQCALCLGLTMRVVRELWRRLRGWWLLSAAAAVTALLSWLGQAYPGAYVGAAVAVGVAVVAVVAERGRRELDERAKAKKGSRPYVERVDGIRDPIRLGVHPAAAAKTPEGGTDRTPRFVDRDRLPDVCDALDAGGFVLVVGDSMAGTSSTCVTAWRGNSARSPVGPGSPIGPSKSRVGW